MPAGPPSVSPPNTAPAAISTQMTGAAKSRARSRASRTEVIWVDISDIGQAFSVTRYSR
jgi:hypothetical protein